MKLALIAGLGAAVLGLAGCASNGALTPAAQNTINTTYNALCVGSAAQPSYLSVAQTIPTNAQRQADIKSLQAICNNGSPTNALTATVDGLTVYALLQRDFPSLKLK